MTDRCEPPPEMRDVDGWHWVQFAAWPPRFAEWQAAPHAGRQPLWKDYERQQSCTPEWAHKEWGWRYLAPVATPAEVKALRAELAEWREIPDAMGLHPNQPAIATTGIAALDMVGAGCWPGARIHEDVVTFDALNGRRRYRIERPGRDAATTDCSLTLIEGAPLRASPQGGAQGGGDAGAPGAPDEGQSAQGRDVLATSQGDGR